MRTRIRCTFVISWSQTDTDGINSAPPSGLTVGSTWSWRGDAVRIDGPSAVFGVDQDDEDTYHRKRAARMVRRLVGAALSGTSDLSAIKADDPATEAGFVVTDGSRSYTVTVIDAPNGAPPLLMFLNDTPPADRNLWVVHHNMQRLQDPAAGEQAGGVICFTPGTLIRTPRGQIRVEDLREGDLVQTKDNGVQPVQWIGSRRMTGARLFAMPKLRPIRFASGALGDGEPDGELLVSPEHRMVVRGAVAQALFNTPEVLVSARDLVNGHSIQVDTHRREVTYIHLMLPRHEVLFANGLESESFHPANTAFSAISDQDRARLLALQPKLQTNPHLYGGYARRNLSASEAAILRYEAA